jgi:DNA-binding HxlR family transcriptional regulator
LKRTHLPETGGCKRISELLSRVGDKWSVLVIAYLGHGPLRFSELQRQVAPISQKMLTTTLRALERDGFVTRTVFPTIPPRVDYELTDLGRDLLKPINGLTEWALKNTDRIDAARARFEKKSEAARDGRPRPASAADGRRAAR